MHQLVAWWMSDWEGLNPLCCAGRSPYLYPLYGLGELPQGFARLRYFIYSFYTYFHSYFKSSLFPIPPKLLLVSLLVLVCHLFSFVFWIQLGWYIPVAIFIESRNFLKVRSEYAPRGKCYSFNQSDFGTTEISSNNLDNFCNSFFDFIFLAKMPKGRKILRQSTYPHKIMRIHLDNQFELYSKNSFTIWTDKTKTFNIRTVLSKSDGKVSRLINLSRFMMTCIENLQNFT